ncbi:MAG TPA: ABC transporter ATP-binding protein [Sphingobium sp.]
MHNMAITPISVRPPALSVRGLRVELARRGAPIVADIDLTLAPGEILGLVGESGSGKTTLANALLGYARRGTRMAAGEVWIDGRDILSLPDAEQRAARGNLIAYVPQDPATALNPLGRIGAALAETLAIHRADLPAGQRDEAIRKTVRDVGLPDDRAFLARYPHQLSGGQQQRVLLALAFILRPQVVVLDEPTTALDVTTQAQVLELIRKLCREQEIAAVYVSHDLAIVRELVDRTAVLYAGRLVELARSSAIFAYPSHPYTRGLLAAVPDIHRRQRLTSIPGHTAPPGRRPDGCAFAPRCDRATEICRSTIPVLKDVGIGALAACHHPVEQTLLDVRPAPAVPETVAQSPALLIGSDINAAYGATQVLFDVAFALPPHRCTALVGQSGSGKTTLARALGGLGDNVSGDLSLNGVPIGLGSAPRSRELRRRVQYVFQNPYRALNPRQSVGRNLTEVVRHFFPVSKEEALDRAAAAVARVSLPIDVLDRRPTQLSGGERQRIAIARALLCEPEILVCDEITSALDVSVQAAVLELLQKLKEDGLTLLFVTHDLAVVRAIADHILVLKDGRIVESGTADDVLDRPASAYTRRLIADSPRLADLSLAS